MDSFGAHDDHSLPELSNVEVCVLPPNSTSKLQPLDAGIIASMKMRYRLRQMKRAVDLANVDENDIYKINILTAMNWMSEVWTKVTNGTISNYWRTKSLMVEEPFF